jgi:hypothetical protein
VHDFLQFLRFASHLPRGDSGAHVGLPILAPCVGFRYRPVAGTGMGALVFGKSSPISSIADGDGWSVKK